MIVECKQDPPTVEDIRQLRHYIGRLKRDLQLKARGILVHGGARKLHSKVRHEAKGVDGLPPVEVFQYKLDVDFAPSC